MALKETHELAQSALKLASIAHEQAKIAHAKHDAHEKICADRYSQIIAVNLATQKEIKDHHAESVKEAKSIRNKVIAVCGVIIASLLGVLYQGVIRGSLGPIG